MHRAARGALGAALAALLLAGALAGCASSAPTARGEVQGASFQSGELLQSDGNRLTQAAMRANLASLRRLADKLYRRNPAEWRKTAATREAALAQLDASVLGGQPWAPLQGQRDVAALSMALSPGFTGDRVAPVNMEVAASSPTWRAPTRRFSPTWRATWRPRCGS